MRRLALLVSISALVLAMLPLGAVNAAAPEDRVPGSYIVVLKDGDPGAVASEHSRRHDASVRYVYRHALRGYAARMSAQAAANVSRDPRVDYVEADGVVTTQATQTPATWGLDRIDQRNRTLDNSYTYATTATNVHAYVIDTGIKLTHGEFTNRIGNGFDAVTSGGNADDCNGHGTHVAGTIGGTVYGVAKGVRLHPVRVLSCSGSGTWSGVIAGIDWVRNNAVKPAVANMSLGGGASTAVDSAVNNLINSGVTVAVAAGNGNQGGKEQDACGYSPARVPAALTIGATTQSDAKTSWSNYGDCVDFFAPGYQITSAWYTSNTATNTISGTSMATPHVAGAAALYLAGNTSAAPAQVSQALYAATTKGIVTASNTANNDLLYTGPATGTTPPPSSNTAPTAVAVSTTVTAGQSVDITLTGRDAEQCNLNFATSNPSLGTLGSLSARSCTSGSPNTDTAVVTYTAGSNAGSDSFTYTVNDGSLTSSPATVSIEVTAATVTPPPSGGSVTDSITASQYGGKNSTNHVDILVRVTDDAGAGVAGATVTIAITRNGAAYTSGSGTTSTGGVVWSLKNPPSGSYVATVTNVTPPSGMTWTEPGSSTTWTK